MGSNVLSGKIVMVCLAAGALAALPGRTSIPPLIESDYCYLLSAADRWHDGQGPTAPLPAAPGQPWDWTADWGFLTQWPVGYPALICGVRLLLGAETLDAARWINVLFCALALAGWFMFVRRVMPNGLTGWIGSALAGTSALSVGQLLNPSTDLLLIALLPYVLCLILDVIDPTEDGGEAGDAEHGLQIPTRLPLFKVALAGLVAGLLCWVRYASVFVAAGVAAFLTMRWLAAGRRRSPAALICFAVFAGLPLATLVAVNRLNGLAGSIQAQLNLGQEIEPAFSLGMLWTVWTVFTDLGYYDHHRWMRWLFALFPMALGVGALISPHIGSVVKEQLRRPAIGIGAAVLGGFMLMILAAGTLFGAKYPFPTLDRYYLPVRPLYFVLFVGPVLTIANRWMRSMSCVGLLMLGVWVVQVDWVRAYQKERNRTTEITPSGARAEAFTPRAAALYDWLTSIDSPELVVVSNFHEYILLETGIPALPIPPDRATLDGWLGRIRAGRRIGRTDVLFVLDPSNRWRDYWITPVPAVMEAFALRDRVNHPDSVSAHIFRYHASPPDGFARRDGT